MNLVYRIPTEEAVQCEFVEIEQSCTSFLHFTPSMQFLNNNLKITGPGMNGKKTTPMQMKICPEYCCDASHRDHTVTLSVYVTISDGMAMPCPCVRNRQVSHLISGNMQCRQLETYRQPIITRHKFCLIALSSLKCSAGVDTN